MEQTAWLRLRKRVLSLQMRDWRCMVVVVQVQRTVCSEYERDKDRDRISFHRGICRASEKESWYVYVWLIEVQRHRSDIVHV